ncbi:MAG: rhodanese-like domain-containing protein [Methylotenera sp.]|nr:rhodanese-like domain-containing protein [Methylotenera sp.]
MIKQNMNLYFSKWIMIAATSSVLFLVGCMPSDIPSVSPKEVVTMLSDKNTIIVDVREDIEWKQQHITGAIHIPLAQVASRLSELAQYKNSNVVVQCRSGKRSEKATSTLQDAGFTKVYNLTGGIIAWDKDGLATTKSRL